jgi:hypothetical protein
MLGLQAWACSHTPQEHAKKHASCLMTTLPLHMKSKDAVWVIWAAMMMPQGKLTPARKMLWT